MRLDKQKQQEEGTTRDENIPSNQNIQLIDPDVAQTKGRPIKSNKRPMPMVERIKETQKKKIHMPKLQGFRPQHKYMPWQIKREKTRKDNQKVIFILS